MKTDRVIMALAAGTLLMQAGFFYLQFAGREGPSLKERVEAAPKGATVNLERLPTRGRIDATVVMVEFSDYACPFCARHANTVAGQLDKQFIQAGKLRHAFANNPLSIHPNARMLARAAICAGEQGQYWQMHRRLFQSTPPKVLNEIESLLSDLSLDRSRFSSCFANEAAASERIDIDIEAAGKLGLTSTPGFALGHTDKSGQVHVRKIIRGAVPFAVFEAAIDEMLSEKPPL